MFNALQVDHIQKVPGCCGVNALLLLWWAASADSREGSERAFMRTQQLKGQKTPLPLKEKLCLKNGREGK